MATRSESSCMERRANTIVCAVLFVNILIAIAVISLFAAKRGMLTSSDTGKWKFELSLEKMYHEIYGNLQPSAETSIHARAAPSLEFLSLLKPVVHLSGLDFDQPVRKNEEISAVRNWALSEGSERTLMYNGMNYENGSIIVPATGVYFIYSHVEFYVEDNKKEHKPTFFHEIYRYSTMTKAEKNVVLNKETYCKEDIKERAALAYPSDIHGLVYLNRGDRLTVKVSHLNLLKHDRQWHYFGGYLV